MTARQPDGVNPSDSPLSVSLEQLQQTICERDACKSLDDYAAVTDRFLRFITSTSPTRIVSPTAHKYIFYQYSRAYEHRITRPLNTDLFIEDGDEFKQAVQRLHDVLDVVRKATRDSVKALKRRRLDPRDIDRVVYTVQQSVGSVGDSLSNPNRARKRVGQLFENLVRLIISEVGVSCDSRTIKVPLPGYEGRYMSYELDLVLSRGSAIVASETEIIERGTVVGSVKTTSTDRLDKVFLDKFLLSKLLGRDVRVFAVFLHDVQRAKKGGSIFGINSTFKTNHFLGYTIALNPLDGVYYVDPQPVMEEDPMLARTIGRFAGFITGDLWRL